jgi:hypothetical protein
MRASGEAASDDIGVAGVVEEGKARDMKERGY